MYVRCNVVTLHRRDRASWDFMWSDEYDGYIHKTRYGTMYKIFFEVSHSSLFVWIGRRVDDGNRAVWVTWERELRADYIDTGRTKIMFKGD